MKFSKTEIFKSSLGSLWNEKLWTFQVKLDAAFIKFCQNMTILNQKYVLGNKKMTK